MKNSLAWVMTIIMALTVFSICQTDMSYAAVKVTSLNLTNVGDTYTINKGKTKKLKYSIVASKKKYKKVKWKSSNRKVLTVSSKGKIKARKNGTAWITVYAKSNKKIKDKVFVRVGTPVSAVSLSKSLYYVKQYEQNKDLLKLSGKVTPSTASNKTLYWTSSNPEVATVDQTGTVKGIKRGKVTITVRATDGCGAYASATVKVVHLYQDEAFFIAHRGYSSHNPENTLPAFEAAARLGFDGCEMDVWETEHYTVDDPEQQDSDLQLQPEEDEHFDLMIMHNSNIKDMCKVDKSISTVNVTNRDNYPIKSGNEIDKFDEPLLIPTLEEALATIYETREYHGTSTIPVIELKAESYSDEAITEIMDLIEVYGGSATIISFEEEALNQAQAAIDSGQWNVSVDTQFLKSSATKGTVDKCVKNGYSGISIGYNYINKEVVDYAHSKGLAVACWTLPSQIEAARVIDLGADRITSNYKLYY